MSKVALIRCESYEYNEVKKAVQKGLQLIGGAEKFAHKGQKVLLKPNLLVGEHPEKCVTTHPSVFKAVGEIFLKEGAVVSWGDSPGFGSTASVANKAGILKAAGEIGIPMADFKTGVEVFYENGIQNKKFIIAKAVVDNEIIISLPKLKPHAFEKFTGCVKNQFGCIPGVKKSEYHIKLPDAEKFAKMLVDLNNFVHPALFVMDGIYAMEGNGPRGGTPKKMNVLLFSNDPVALDATVCRLINLNPEYVPTIKYGYQTGSGTYIKDKIELLGDDFRSFIQNDFNINRSPLKPFKDKGLFRFLSNRLVPKPYILKEKCVKCGMCINMCPTAPKSVDWFDGDMESPPVHNYRTCIRCYCCQEICPESAIRLKFPFLRRMFGGK
ncbi:MAG: DUF362 domain-containing protein [Spirochaetes bacterium]|nr:DUF362 domain-containing protein [Spirochaetota bacterium]